MVGLDWNPSPRDRRDLRHDWRDLCGGRLGRLSGQEPQVKHFELEEFACPCCDDNEMDLMFVMALDKARESAATPFVVNSGYRCADHNEHVGGSETSSHLKGLAADIDASGSHARFLILRSLLEHGFTRIGIAGDFIHVDVDDSKPSHLIWTY